MKIAAKKDKLWTWSSKQLGTKVSFLFTFWVQVAAILYFKNDSKWNGQAKVTVRCLTRCFLLLTVRTLFL